MKKIAIIPARGGSKRIPRKNIKDFLGKPIIAYSIKTAINSGIFDEIMVSTDDPEIAEIAKKYGAHVPFLRSPGTANDTATTPDVLVEVINEYQKAGQDYNYACCIYPCAPFITSERLKEGLETMLNNKAKSAVPVVKYSYPIQRALRIDAGKLEMILAENINTRSQDLEPTYHDIGQYYWIELNNFINNPVLFSDNTVAVITPESEVQDIDTEEDWKIAELKYKILMETK